ncbi:MAG: flagellar hook assembly protein FlgD [Deltaproteobacteria bacterium]|nr:flagellar hook assembly protein FlgD [Deltaproteobacteria bacterium]
MMMVGTVNSATTTVAQSKNTVDKEAFFKMLIAQLKNQDPLNPMDGTDFTAQLAQFSSLEQLENINSQMTSFIDQQDSLAAYQAVDLIGKEVTVEGNAFQFDGSSATLLYSLAETAADGTLTLYDVDGKAVKVIALGPQGAGLSETAVTASDLPGPGLYSYEVAAFNQSGLPVTVQQAVKGVVEGVSLNGEVPSLIVLGLEAPMASLIAVGS